MSWKGLMPLSDIGMMNWMSPSNGWLYLQLCSLLLNSFSVFGLVGWEVNGPRQQRNKTCIPVKIWVLFWSSNRAAANQQL